MIQKGLTYEEFRSGDTYQTARRTITEGEVVQFVNLVGLVEPLFIDAEYIRDQTEYGERIAPGSLTFALAEGLTVQTGLIHGTGLAFVGLEEMRLFQPVKVGDTISVHIEVLGSRKAKSRDAGIVRYRHIVNNQRGETVMEYTVSRLIRGRAD
jgi:acyl dehydratase